MTYFMQENYSVYDSLPCSAAVFLMNENLDIVYSNAVYDEMFASKYIKIDNMDRDIFNEVLVSANEPKCVYFRSKNAHGKRIDVRAFVIRISDEKAFALMIDDSEKTDMPEVSDNKCARYVNVIKRTRETFYEYNMKTDILSVFSCSDEGEITVRDFEGFLKGFDNDTLIHDEDKEALQEIIGKELTKEIKFDMRMRISPEGEFEWYKIFVRPDERDGVFVGSAKNINDSKEEEEQLKEKALIDPLSKVYNRSAAIEKIEKQLKKRAADNEFALIVLDIDNFKRINDTFGHLYGDAVIAMAAGSIKSTLDREDIMGRFGGDEFFVFINNAEKEALEKKLEAIRLAVLKMRLDQNDDNDISCSIGVAIGAGGAVYEEMFRQADSALYAAKGHGKNRFEYFDGTYSSEEALSYAGVKDEDESNEAHNITAIALEIASKSTSGENAIINIMRHIGMAIDLDCIQIMKFDTVEDRVHLEFQWWRELNGAYNVVATEKKMGYYNHNDLVIFRNRFAKDKIFKYTPDFKEGFSLKYRDVFENSEHVSIVYASNTENESIFYAVTFQDWNKDRVWTESDFHDMSEITKILSMYLKSSYVTTEREKMLMDRIDYDPTGLYGLQKMYDETGRIGREARANGEILGVLDMDIKDLYSINITHGNEVGDEIMLYIADCHKKIDPNKVITGHISGTDRFITVFRTKSKEGVAEAVEKEMEKICEAFAEYKNPSLILKGAIGFFNPGERMSDYLDAAKAIKKRREFDRCECIVAENVKSAFNIKK